MFHRLVERMLVPCCYHLKLLLEHLGKYVYVKNLYCIVWGLRYSQITQPVYSNTLIEYTTPTKFLNGMVTLMA